MWAWCIQHIEPDNLEEWKMQMDMPLPGEEHKVSASVEDDEGQSFLNLMGALGGASR